MSDLDYDNLALWKDGVSEENIDALAENTEDIAGRLDYFAEEYREGRVEDERLTDLMKLGKRVIEAEDRLKEGQGCDGQDYLNSEMFSEEIEKQAGEIIGQLELEPEEIDFEADEEYLENEAVEEFLAYSDDPETRLWSAQEQYLTILSEVRDLSGIEVIKPENTEYDEKRQAFIQK